jgi:ketosteroid isomerase-like protein
MSQKPIFASPQDVEAAFYDALERGDLAAIMAVWSEDEEIICVHPGGPLLVGYATVQEAWRRIFDHGRKLEVRLSVPTVVTTPFAVVHSLIEHIRVQTGRGVGEGAINQAPVAATNIYVRGALGWRMVAHHSSPVPPDSLSEAPKVLH